MDKNFLKFWGSVFNSAAESQEMMENMSKLYDQGLNSSVEVQEMFKKFYAPEKEKENVDFQKTAEQSFQAAFQSFLSLFQAVSKEEHQDLVEKYDALKEKVDQQEDTIRQLKKILGAKNIQDTDVTKDFENLVKTQSEQFQNLVKSFGNFYTKGSDGKEKK